MLIKAVEVVPTNDLRFFCGGCGMVEIEGCSWCSGGGSGAKSLVVQVVAMAMVLAVVVR